MRTLAKTFLALCMVALLAAPSWAQQGRGFGGGGGGLMLLTNKGVQKELKVSDDQATKLETFAQGLRDKQREEFQKLQDVPQDERREKMQELGRATNAEMYKGLGDILKAEQVSRLRQIQLQSGGPNSFTTPQVQEKLNLTADQKQKIKELNDTLGTSTREAAQNFQSDREGTMKKITELRKEATEKVHGVLTDEQKKTWKEMTGEPYEVKFEPRPSN